MTTLTTTRTQSGESGLTNRWLSDSPPAISNLPTTQPPVAGGSAANLYNRYHPLLYHLPKIGWAVFGTLTWTKASRRVDSRMANQKREWDFKGVLRRTCVELGLRDKNIAIYKATEFGAAGECHLHFLVAKEGLKHVIPQQFAQTFAHLWYETFRPLDSELSGVGKAEVEPYDQAQGQRGVAYCLKREWDEKGREQERYDYISHKLFNLLQRAGGAFSPDSRVSLDEKSSFKNN